MVNRFDVVAIRVEHKGSVVARVVRALTRWSVVLATCAERGPVESLNGGAIGGLEGEMDAGDVVIGRIDEQLVGVEKIGTLLHKVGPTQRGEHCAVEAFAGREIRDAQMNMIEQSASVEFHDDLRGCDQDAAR